MKAQQATLSLTRKVWHKLHGMQTQMHEAVSNPTDTMHRSESNHLLYCIALAHKISLCCFNVFILLEL